MLFGLFFPYKVEHINNEIVNISPLIFLSFILSCLFFTFWRSNNAFHTVRRIIQQENHLSFALLCFACTVQRHHSSTILSF
ncbi:hypothetical protein Scep_022623 [Stephania cephalantha]|uniref:Uncharacterized protein n=1 Tax=Stephania cephalantha TaxID=152367 RepID=A0AAP0I2U5_9MAGN